MGISEEMLRDKKTGLQSNIHRYEDLYILCFAGFNDVKDLYANNMPLSLHEAALTGRLEQIDVLLSKKREINQQDNMGNAPLYYALNNHALRSAIKLLENGADWRIRDPQVMNAQEQFKNHIIGDDILTDEGRALRATLLDMMK